MTADEQAVLNMLLAGHTVAQAAERLGYTYYQADHAKRTAMKRLGVHSREELMAVHGVKGRAPHPHRTHEHEQREIYSRRRGPGRERVKTLAREFGLNESTVFRIIKRMEVVHANEEAERMLQELDEPLKEVV